MRKEESAPIHFTLKPMLVGIMAVAAVLSFGVDVLPVDRVLFIESTSLGLGLGVPAMKITRQIRQALPASIRLTLPIVLMMTSKSVAAANAETELKETLQIASMTHEDARRFVQDMVNGKTSADRNHAFTIAADKENSAELRSLAAIVAMTSNLSFPAKLGPMLTYEESSRFNIVRPYVINGEPSSFRDGEGEMIVVEEEFLRKSGSAVYFFTAECDFDTERTLRSFHRGDVTAFDDLDVVRMTVIYRGETMKITCNATIDFFDRRVIAPIP